MNKNPVAAVAERLSLAATPTFAAMALLTIRFDGARPDMLCSAPSPVAPLTGMTPMYLLMAAFHAAPWLRLIARRLTSEPSTHGR